MIHVVEYLKIPEERLKLLLEENEKLKKSIEKSTQTRIEISEGGEISVEEQTQDPLSAWKARDIIKAIGRGFEPDIAMQLLEENTELKIIELKDFVGKSKNALVRIKGRIIGREGKAKQKIEELTNTSIVVHGKTVSIIGKVEQVQLAANAISMLCSGSMHGSVYKMLEREISKGV